MRKEVVSFGERKLGSKFPCFVIAEIGVNHNGDMKLAREMIDAAKESGADCVKFQSFRADEFMADRELVYEYISQGKSVKEKMYDMFKRLELSKSNHDELFKYARSQAIMPLTSVADRESALLAQALKIDGLKLASEDLINLPLVEFVAELGLPLILSTGMATQEEVGDALAILKKHSCEDVVFLHCVSVYPTPDREVNLSRMLALGDFVQGPVGYSDHSEGIEAPLAAVALGACVIEKHFTTDRNLPGPDQALSANPDEFKKMVDGIRRIESFRGEKNIQPSETEWKTRIDFRRSIVASENLELGHKIRLQDLALKRPAKGLMPREMNDLVGRVLKKAVRKDENILKTHFE